MNKHIYVSIAIIALPFLLLLAGASNHEVIGNIGQLLEMLYLSPGFVAKDELFGFQKDIGLLPTNLGRFLVTSFYLLVYWSVVFLIKRSASSEDQHS